MKKTPDTLEEIHNEGYEIIIYEKELGHLSQLQKLGLKLRTQTEITSYLTFERNDKVAIFFERSPDMKDKRYLDMKNHKFPMKIIKDDFVTELSGFGGFRNNVLLKPFADAFVRLFEAGITNHILKNALKMFRDQIIASSSGIKDHENEVLTVEHLEAGLLLWLGCVALSIIAFIVELIVFHIKKKMQRKKFRLAAVESE